MENLENDIVNQRFSNIEKLLEEVMLRNKRVEVEKAWETSRTRIIAIVAVTYLLMCLIFFVIGVENFMLNAVIPTIGYYLSTQSLPAIKKRWIEKRGASA